MSRSPARFHRDRMKTSNRRISPIRNRRQTHSSPDRYKSRGYRSPERRISSKNDKKEVYNYKTSHHPSSHHHHHSSHHRHRSHPYESSHREPQIHRHKNRRIDDLRSGEYTFKITRNWNHSPSPAPEIEAKVCIVKEPTTWYDLPFEMKEEVLKYLSIADRCKFAQCSIQISMDVFKFERNWSSVNFEKTRDGYWLNLGSGFSKENVKIDFKKVRDSCEIRWNWCENERAIRKEVVRAKNVAKVAYDFFESLIPKFKNSLRTLNMKKIDMTFPEKSIKCFPKLQQSSISTSEEKTIYWLLSNSPDLTSLIVSFRKDSSMFKAKQFQNFMILKSWSLDKLIDLEMETNLKSVAENVVSRAKHLSTFKYKFHCDDPRSNDRIVQILKSSNVKNLEFFSCLENQQFIDLVKTCERVKCSLGNITFNGIHRLIEELMNNDIRRNFSICYVDDIILESTPLNLTLSVAYPRARKQQFCTVYKNKRVRQHMFNVLVGELRYFKERRFLTFQMVIR